MPAAKVIGRGALVLALTLASASTAYATVPSAITVQGVLRDGAGKLQSLSVDLSVSFFDAQQAGKQLAGPFNFPGTLVEGGLFTRVITDNGLAAKLAVANAVWMQITITEDGLTDVFPRQQLTSSVYALTAATAENALSLGGTPASAWAAATSIKDGNDHDEAMVRAPFPGRGIWKDVSPAVVLAARGKGFFLVSLNGRMSGEFPAGRQTIYMAGFHQPFAGQPSASAETSAFALNPPVALNATVPLSLSWVVPTDDTKPHTFTAAIMSDHPSPTVESNVEARLHVLWFPSP